MTENDALMKMIDSKKGYHPMPVDQYSTYVDGRYPPKIRLWAWMMAALIKQGRRKTPYCADGEGKPLTLKNAARDLKLDKGNVARAFAELCAEHRASRDPEGRLKVTGDFKLPPMAPVVCTDNSRAYISKQLNKLPKATRELLIETDKQLFVFGRKLQADLVAAARNIIDQQHDSLFARFGVKTIRAAESRRKATSPYLLVILKELEPALTQFAQVSVQTTSEGLYNTENVVSTDDVSAPHPYTSELQRKPIAGGRATMPQEPTAKEPETPARPLLIGLVQRGFTPDVSLLNKLYEELGDTSDDVFFRTLDQRMRRGSIGNGLLVSVAQRASQNYAAIRMSEAAEEDRQAGQRKAQEERYRQQAREVLADLGASEADREWANEILKTTQVA